jgi:hypothetical protein
MSHKYHDPILIDQVVQSIKFQGLTPATASKQFGVHVKSIYYWLKKEGVTTTTDLITGTTRNKSDTLLIANLRQENKELKELLGSTHLDLSKFKKNILAKVRDYADINNTITKSKLAKLLQLPRSIVKPRPSLNYT